MIKRALLTSCSWLSTTTMLDQCLNLNLVNVTAIRPMPTCFEAGWPSRHLSDQQPAGDAPVIQAMIKAFKQETQWVCMAMIILMSLIPTSGASDLLAEDLAVPTTTPCSTINASVLNWAGASNTVIHLADQQVLRKPKSRRRRRRKNNLPGLIGKRRYLMKQSEKGKIRDMKLQMTC